MSDRSVRDEMTSGTEFAVLVERYESCTRAALDALHDERWDKLSSALRERGILAQRLEPILERARLDASPHDSATPRERAELLSRLLTLQDIDSRLHTELADTHASVRSELDERRQSSTSAGYSSASATAGLNIDLVR